MTELEKTAKVVRRARLREGWTQAELAARAKIGSSTLERIEQGKPPVATQRIMQKIARAFGREYDQKKGAFIESESEADGPIVLSEELSALVRDYAAQANVDPLEWLEFAINDAAPTPVTPEPGVVRRRSGTRRLPQGGAQPSNVGAAAR